MKDVKKAIVNPKVVGIKAKGKLNFLVLLTKFVSKSNGF